MKTSTICEHCQGDGREPVEERSVKGVYPILIYGDKKCKYCGGTGKDHSVSIDELEEQEDEIL